MVVALNKGDVVPLEPEIVDAQRIAANNLLAAGRKLADDMAGWAGWFLVAVQTGREEAVKEAMEEENIHAWVPYFDKEVTLPASQRGGKRNRKPRKDITQVMAFPGYIAVRTVPSGQAWHALMQFRCVLGVMVGDLESWSNPLASIRLRWALSDKTLARIHKLEAELKEDLSLQTITFLGGDRVRVTDGPMLGLVGIVSSKEARYGAVWVDLDLFGRITPVELWVDQLTEVD